MSDFQPMKSTEMPHDPMLASLFAAAVLNHNLAPSALFFLPKCTTPTTRNLWKSCGCVVNVIEDCTVK
jgi:hypothetical protein